MPWPIADPDDAKGENSVGMVSAKRISSLFWGQFNDLHGLVSGFLRRPFFGHGKYKLNIIWGLAAMPQCACGIKTLNEAKETE